MSEPTKACSLTEEEIKALIFYHTRETIYKNPMEDAIERINYLNKRRKSFNEVEIVKEASTQTNNVKDGW